MSDPAGASAEPRSVASRISARPWALGLLWFVPILGAIIAPIALSVLAVKFRNEVDARIRENTRWAANWMLTVTMLTFSGVCFVAINTMLDRASFTPVFLLFALCQAVVWCTHLGVSVRGAIVGRHRVYRPRAAIPLINSAYS